MTINGITLNFFNDVIEHAKQGAEKYRKSYYLTAQKLRGLWRKVALVVHPDKGGNTEDFKLAQNEYQDLLDSLSKRPAFTAMDDSPEAYDDFTDFLAHIHPRVHEAFRQVVAIKGINCIDVVGWYIYVEIDENTQQAELAELKQIRVNGISFKYHTRDKRWFWAGIRAMGVPMTYARKKEIFSFNQFNRKPEETKQITA